MTLQNHSAVERCAMADHTRPGFFLSAFIEGPNKSKAGGSKGLTQDQKPEEKSLRHCFFLKQLVICYDTESQCRHQEVVIKGKTGDSVAAS